jgi:RNA polymerase sigma-70 factor (ECF subfamily)
MDEEHFRLFFRENYKVACLIAYRYVKNMDQSEDLVQDVFTAFWERRATVGNYQNNKNYLLTAVRNHSLNFIHRERRDQISLSDIFREIPEEDSVVFYDREMLAVNILNAIDELPPQCKKIFNLAYHKDQTYQEIADQLNLSKNTVKTQMGIAYKSLRQKLNSLLIIGLFIYKKIF